MPNLNSTFGAYLIGVYVSLIVYGITILQTFIYFQNYWSDGIVMKSIVASLWTLETVRQAFSAHAAYHYLVINYFNPPELERNVWTIPINTLTTAIIILITHFCFIQRVWYVSKKNKWIVAGLTIICLVHFGVMVALFEEMWRAVMLSDYRKSNTLIFTALALSLVTDGSISIALTYFLYSNRTGIPSTDSVVNRIIALIVNNGILLSGSDVVIVILVSIMSHNFIYMGVFQVVGNLYVNAVLATLNARNHLRAHQKQKELSGSGGWRNGRSMAHNQAADNRMQFSLQSMQDTSHDHSGERTANLKSGQGYISSHDDEFAYPAPPAVSRPSLAKDMESQSRGNHIHQ